MCDKGEVFFNNSDANRDCYANTENDLGVGGASKDVADAKGDYAHDANNKIKFDPNAVQDGVLDGTGEAVKDLKTTDAASNDNAVVSGALDTNVLASSSVN